jgi:hypothetical protein
VSRLLATIGSLKVEADLLREQLTTREQELQGARDALAAAMARTSLPTAEVEAGTIKTKRTKGG